MAEIIRVSPDQLRDIASQLDGHRNEIEGLLETVISKVHGLQGEWTGLAEKDYMQVFDNEVPPMKPKIAQILEDMTQRLRRAADVLEQADQAAA